MNNKDLMMISARIRAGLNQKDAAGKLGVSVGALSNYENRLVEPKRDLIKKMSLLYNVPPSYFFID